MFSDPLEGPGSAATSAAAAADGFSSSGQYHDVRKKSTTSSISNQSHLCLGSLPQHTTDHHEDTHVFDDMYDPIMAEYQSEKEELQQQRQQQQLLKRQLSPITHDSAASRGPYGRFDPVLNRLCT